MKTLTFLVPCYNVEGTVRRCIDSMLVEEVLDDIEVLLVNDGSTDGTSSIIHEYEERYPSVVRVIDKENGGWGTAINLGIREARGRYVKEVDSDDWVSSENVIGFVKFLKENEIDFIATEYCEYYDGKRTTESHTYHSEIYNKTLTLDEFWSNHTDSWSFPIHAITYRTDFLKRIGLTVGDRYYCDFEYFLYPLPFIHSIHVLPLNITVYYRGNDNQSTSTIGYARHYKDMASLSLRLTRFYDTIPESTNINCRQHIFRTIAGTVELSYELMMSPVYAGGEEETRSYLSEYDHQLKQTSPLFYKEMGLRKKRGIPYIKLWRKLGINPFLLRI